MAPALTETELEKLKTAAALLETAEKRLPVLRTLNWNRSLADAFFQSGEREPPKPVYLAPDPAPSLELVARARSLIHGSSEGRFHITYCPGDGLRQEEVESVGFNYLRYEEAVARFQTESLEDGWHMDRTGLPFYFVRNPGLGLWATRERFGN